MKRTATIYLQAITRAARLFPRVRDVELRCDPRIERGPGAKPRDMAYCMGSRAGAVIAVAPRVEKQTRARMRGLLWHEIGHAVDFLYTPGEIERVLRLAPGTISRALPEARADTIGRALFGRIVYDREHVQQGGKGAKGSPVRPSHLPR